MNLKLRFCVFILVQTCFGDPMFFHEPSHLVLKPNEELHDKADFSFSMGYQRKYQRLVVGCPHADLVGRVYGCPIDGQFNKITCEKLDIDVKRLAADYDKNDPEQKFCLGATIATTSEYFLTCAPLWTTTGVKHTFPGQELPEYRSGSYGTCFVYYDANKIHEPAHRMRGIIEQMKNPDGNNTIGHMYGGLGWSSLADEESKILLTAKSFNQGDIQYIDSSHLELDEKRPTRSLYYSDFRESFEKFRDVNKALNIGYAFAAGKFFSDFGKTVYAFSMKGIYDYGQVGFLYLNNSNVMNIVQEIDGQPKSLLLQTSISGDMYGAAMWSTDMNADKWSDLLVGAPTHAIRGSCETGALYIHLGGLKRMMTKTFTRLVVVSSKARSRFGAAIATNDLDGDSIPEIFVSAPYEDSGVGALYIISGYEVMTTWKMQEAEKKNSKNSEGISLKLEELKWTQRIQNKNFKSFGLSLQVIDDIDDNGCDELAVGSPRTNNVMLLRCIPTITANLISRKLSNETVKTSDTSFAVEVCVNVTYQLKPKNISTKLKVVSQVNGRGASLLNNTFEVDLSKRIIGLNCENVTVTLRKGETGIYRIDSQLEYLDENIFMEKEFDPTWVKLSKNSYLHNRVEVQRLCKETTCTPNLRMDFLWGGSKVPEEFYLDKKTIKTVTLLINNDGVNAYDACVVVKVSGAKETLKCPPSDDDPERYHCPLPKPLASDATHSISIVLDIERVTNINDTVHIATELYNDCNSAHSTSGTLDVKLRFAIKYVNVISESHNVNVTNTQIDNGKNSTFIDKHEYRIVNNGNLQWDNVTAVIIVQKEAYIQNYTILIKDEGTTCVEKDNTADLVKFLCTGIKLYDVPIPVYVRTEIPYAKIRDNLVDTKLQIKSQIEVRMISDDKTSNILKTQKTIITYVVETSLGNNKTAIIWIVIFTALLILAVIAFTLYKVGFFKRKEISRLNSIKASVRSKDRDETGDKPSTSGAGELNRDSKEESMEDLDIEVIDDCPFDLVPINVNDKTTLIDEDKYMNQEKEKPSRLKSSIASTSSQVDKHTSQRDPITSHNITERTSPSVDDDKNKMSPAKTMNQNRQSTRM